MKRNPYPHSPESIMSDYMHHPLLRGEGLVNRLHMFFSPNRVPRGLTDDQISVCIGLYELRLKHKEPKKPPTDAYIDSYDATMLELLSCSFIPPSLPLPLLGLRPMSRGRFRKGIMQFVEEASRKIAKR